MPIPIDKAKQLPKEKKSMGEAATLELIEFLSGQACNAAEIADFWGVNKAGVYSKLSKLVEKGLIQRVYQEEEGGKRAISYWYVPG